MDSGATAVIEETPTLPWTLRNYARSLSILLGRSKREYIISTSKIHFGHWKAWSTSRELTKLACSQLNLITHTGIHPTRCGHGLQVLLEKVPGVALGDKLQAILLMEGDFNFFNKWLFGRVTVGKLYEIGYIPEDQYSKKNSTAEDSKLDNRLTMDLSRQFCQPMVAVGAALIKI
jgi:hypothetical protein